MIMPLTRWLKVYLPIPNISIQLMGWSLQKDPPSEMSCRRYPLSWRSKSKMEKTLPKGWEIKRLGEVAAVGSGNSAPQGEQYFSPGGYPFVRTVDVGVNGKTANLLITKDKVNDLAIKTYSLKLWPKKTLLIPKSG